MIPLNVTFQWFDGLQWRPVDDANHAGDMYIRAAAKTWDDLAQNAAMIARDEPKTYSFSCDSRDLPLIFDCQPIKHQSTGTQCGSAKPAITGLTTVHDGKHRGIGFSSEMVHE